MRSIKWIRAIILLIIPLTLTGCWDSMEINNRSVILELAMDKNKEIARNVSMDQRKRLTFIYSLPDMTKMSGGNSLTKNVKTTVIVKAPTLVESVERLETKTQNTVTFSHVKTIFIGEELLKDGDLFKEVLDGISRNMMLARNIPLLAVKGTAEEAIQVENKQQPILGLYIMRFFNNSERAKSSFKMQLLGNFIREMEDTGIATIPIFHANSEGEIDISGGAVMKDYGLVDYISKQQVKGLLYILGEVKNAPVLVKYQGEYLTYNVKEQKSKMHFKQENGKMACYIDIEVEGDIVEYASSKRQNLFISGDMEAIKDLLQRQIVEEANVAVDKSKEINVDFLGVGRELYRTKTDFWEKNETNWEYGGYLNMPIYTNARVKIRNTGVLQ